MTATQDATIAELQRANEELRRERDAGLAREATLAEALAQRNSEFGERIEQQSATIDVLKVMSASPGDAQPVFNLIVRRATELCNVPSATLFEYDGELVHIRSDYRSETILAPSALAAYVQLFPMRPTRGSISCRAILDRQIIHILDLRLDRELAGFTRELGHRSQVSVPLIRDDLAIGVITIGAQAPGGFSDSQIELLKTFAEQAVIAISSAETYRALQERTEALATRNSEYGERIEHQSATIDVLKAMSASPGDTQPVFDLIVQRARALCNGTSVGLFEYDGKLLRHCAVSGGDEATNQRFFAMFPMVPTRQLLSARAILDRQIVHVRDMDAEPGLFQAVRDAGTKSLLALPLLRDGAPIGSIALNAEEPGGFSDSQVALLQTFAEQAVIAITSAETYRALQTRTSDLQETLEYQTATSDVLNVISRSTFDLQPVLETVVQTSARLCNADRAAIFRREGDLWRLAVNFGFPPAWEDYMKAQGAFSSDRFSEHAAVRAVMERRPVHIDDMAAVPGYGVVRLGEQRTTLGVPLLREGEAIGTIVLARLRVEPFTNRQIELVSTFADQAVIAIENTRLITEQREALEQQTATAEVLQVINASPGNLTPVFEALVETALRLCEAAFGGLATFDGGRFTPVARRGVPPAYAEYRMRVPMFSDAPNIELQRLRDGEDIVHTADLMADDAYRAGDRDLRALVDLGGARSSLLVALRRDGGLLGGIQICRQEVRPFSDRQIALLRNFAAQAVIAMENARLLTEQREALEQQTATAEVLQVINASPGNLAPVFDAILEKAHRLCGATHGSLTLFDGGIFRAVATYGHSEVWAERLRKGLPAVNNPGTEPLLDGARFVHIADMVDINHPLTRAAAEATGVRTALFVPLRRDNRLIGAISAHRREVRPFTEKEIALLENFAAQAVIAMENARLLTETREALEQQTATAEVLGVINSNPGDLAPVFDAMLEKAHGLCGIAMGSLELYDGQRFRAVAVRGLSDAFADMLRQGYPASENPATGPLIDGGRLTHIRDLAETDYAITRSGAELDAGRTLLCVPLRREGTLLGMIASGRKEVRPFSDKEIALLENFAAQAVIAMENARLINEQREALEQQTATAEVLQVINASPGNLTPVFDAILEKAHILCGAVLGSLMIYESGYVRAAATHGFPERHAELVRQPFRISGNPRALIGGARFIHELDVQNGKLDPDDHITRSALESTNIRTGLWLPLRKDGTLLGWISAFRLDVRPFSDKEIALLESFAAQAVIAMENARLLAETREALEQQTATAEVLQVINASPGNLTPVFDAMLEKALHLCECPFGMLSMYDGEAFHNVATRGVTPELTEYLRRPVHTTPGQALHRIVRGGEDVVHEADITEEEGYRDGHPHRHAMADLGGVRTQLVVALRKDDVLLGIICIFRQVVRPFTDKQVALLQTFAAQAVIAMENARLITEQREALEQQTATAEVLQVINASPGNLTPVFDTILDKAHALCGADHGALALYDGERLRAAAVSSVSDAYAERLRQGVRTTGNPIAQPLLDGARFVHIPDQAEIDHPATRTAVEQTGARTVLAVPLRKDDLLLGAITAVRQEVRPFTDKQIALLQNFAAQAVIAIENARLLTEMREALEQQTATAEVLQVINASPGNLVPVFDAILNKAHVLCSATMGNLTSYKDGYCQVLATHGLPEEIASLLRQPYRPNPATQGLIDGERFHQIEDLRAIEINDPVWSERPLTRALIAQTDVRTILLVPLRKDGALLGLITAYRPEVRLFSDKEIALLENFGAQAVVAMENARLLNEIRQRQAELRTTFDNMGDGVAMFDTDLRLVAWNRNFQRIIDLPDTLLETRPSYADYVRLLAERGEFGTTGIEAELSLRIEDTDKELRLERVRPDGRVVEVRRNAVSGGGFVLIYSDITERKRSEEEIRAARDAAETALRELRTAQANLIQAEKMASLGQLTAGIAHEIKNPLNFVNNFAALSVDLLGELKQTAAPGFAVLTDKQRAEVEDVSAMLTSNLEKITEHGKRADGIVKAMLEHSRGSSGERHMIDLNALIGEALNLAYHGARAQDQSFNITLERDFGEGIALIEVNPQDITRVFLNLFANGFYATTRRTRDGGDARFVPTLKISTREAGEAVEIRVWDNGSGIPADIRDKVFQPFFTTKPTGEGTGLGLSITYDIVTQQHGGSITVDSIVGDYSEFTIRLPRNP